MGINFKMSWDFYALKLGNFCNFRTYETAVPLPGHGSELRDSQQFSAGGRNCYMFHEGVVGETLAAENL